MIGAFQGLVAAVDGDGVARDTIPGQRDCRKPIGAELGRVATTQRPRLEFTSCQDGLRGERDGPSTHVAHGAQGLAVHTVIFCQDREDAITSDGDGDDAL